MIHDASFGNYYITFVKKYILSHAASTFSGFWLRQSCSLSHFIFQQFSVKTRAATGQNRSREELLHGHYICNHWYAINMSFFAGSSAYPRAVADLYIGKFILSSNNWANVLFSDTFSASASIQRRRGIAEGVYSLNIAWRQKNILNLSYNGIRMVLEKPWNFLNLILVLRCLKVLCNSTVECCYSSDVSCSESKGRQHEKCLSNLKTTRVKALA